MTTSNYAILDSRGVPVPRLRCETQEQTETMSFQHARVRLKRLMAEKVVRRSQACIVRIEENGDVRMPAYWSDAALGLPR